MKNKFLSGGLFATKPTPLTVRETSLSAQIAQYFTRRNIYSDRLQCGNIQTRSGNWVQLCKNGTPDRFAIINGFIIFIEVKKFGQKATNEQLIRHDELRKNGAIVLVVDSFEKFVKEFSTIQYNLETKGK